MAMIAITCDTFKRDKFKKTLEEHKIKIIWEGDMREGVYLFKVDSQQSIISPIVQELQKFYHDTYKRGN